MMNSVLLIIAILAVSAVCVFLIRRHYQKLLDEAMKRAQKSGHLKTVFIDNISGTLRKPLNAISGFSDMLLENQDENVKELATNISIHAKELGDYVEQLHEMSKFEGITPSFTFIEVNLTELMASYRREALNYTKPEVAIRVSTDLSPHCRAVLDTNLMHQLMMHLLTNAAYHVIQGNIFINYNCERRGLKVTIKYTGVGQVDLVGADLYSFLEKKEALKDSGTSTLFGIAISKAIVDMFGGELFMETENEKKTIVSFWFPCELKDAYKDV